MAEVAMTAIRGSPAWQDSLPPNPTWRAAVSVRAGKAGDLDLPIRQPAKDFELVADVVRRLKPERACRCRHAAGPVRGSNELLISQPDGATWMIAEQDLFQARHEKSGDADDKIFRQFILTDMPPIDIGRAGTIADGSGRPQGLVSKDL